MESVSDVADLSNFQVTLNCSQIDDLFFSHSHPHYDELNFEEVDADGPEARLALHRDALEFLCLMGIPDMNAEMLAFNLTGCFFKRL